MPGFFVPEGCFGTLRGFAHDARVFVFVFVPEDNCHLAFSPV